LTAAPAGTLAAVAATALICLRPVTGVETVLVRPSVAVFVAAGVFVSVAVLAVALTEVLDPVAVADEVDDRVPEAVPRTAERPVEPSEAWDRVPAAFEEAPEDSLDVPLALAPRPLARPLP